MDPYGRPTYPNSNNPNYPNNPYPQMPTPDFNVNVPGGYGGAPTYPGSGGYPSQSNEYGNYQQPGGGYGGYPSAPQPGYPNAPQSGYGGGFPNAAQPGYGAGYPNNQQAQPEYGGGYQNYGGYGGGFPNASASQPGYGGYQPVDQNYGGYSQNNPVPPPVQQGYPGQFQPQPAPIPPSSNLFPNLVGGGIASNNQYTSPGSFSTGQNNEGTVKPFQPFNPIDDAEKLYKAMKGIGTNETVLIDILCRRTNQQRLQIALSFKTAYGKDLLKNVMSETGGDFQDLLKALLTPTVEFEAHELRESLSGIGTDEAALIEIICSKTNAQMLELRSAYKRLFNKDMERDVRGDVSGYLQRILVSLMTGNRSEAPADPNRARQLAQELHKAGEKKLGTDEVTFNRIFALESIPQLKLTFDEYYKMTGHDIDKAIKNEMSGDVERAFLTIARFVKNQPGYFAERLYKSMKGMGTKDRTLIRNVVLRSEIDMRDVKVEFQRQYSKTLESFVKGDLSGDYGRAIRCLIGDPNWK